MYILRIINNKQLPFLQYIATEIKKAGCRIANNYVRNFKIGEQLLLSSKSEFILCEITYLHFYKDFKHNDRLSRKYSVLRLSRY